MQALKKMSSLKKLASSAGKHHSQILGITSTPTLREHADVLIYGVVYQISMMDTKYPSNSTEY